MLAVLLAACQSLIVGCDISDLQLYVDAKAVFKDSAGKTVDPLEFLISKGMDYARVRVFVNPVEGGETGQSPRYVAKLGKRIKDAGLKFLVDFHYSDTWADPGKQTKPSAWRSLATSALVQKVYDYTKATLKELKDSGATPDSIQIGNEVTPGMLWNDGRVTVWSGTYNSETQWNNFFGMLRSGIKAAREVCPGAKIVIHTDRGGDSSTATKYYQKLADGKIDYDIIGLSYYPFWHGSLQQMTSCVASLKGLGKTIWIVETAYAYTQAGVPSDASYKGPWAATPEGQAQYLTAFIKALKGTAAGAFFYWFPEETYSPSKRISGDLHRGLWSNKDGKALPAMDILKEGK
jgi:arabinogalactan endo-1,4-beta-galactosidase